ncbi:MAG: UMP kinase [Eubacteriales bacterium]|nr:UMP kinase [Eubacteriales bacterium]
MSKRRVLLKLSGEALGGARGQGLDPQVLANLATSIRELVAEDIALAVVLGGGNFWRGRSSGDMDRVVADHIGMLATTMNALAFSDALRAAGVPNLILSALSIPKIHDIFRKDKALEAWQEGKVLILAGGTGNPFFSTDSTAALRGAELEVDVILKATLVDGVYDKNPHESADAQLYKELSFTQLLSENLQVMDATAAAICRDNQIPIRVFNMETPGNILKAARGEAIGTLVSCL